MEPTSSFRKVVSRAKGISQGLPELVDVIILREPRIDVDDLCRAPLPAPHDGRLEVAMLITFQVDPQRPVQLQLQPKPIQLVNSIKHHLRRRRRRKGEANDIHIKLLPRLRLPPPFPPLQLIQLRL